MRIRLFNKKLNIFIPILFLNVLFTFYFIFNTKNIEDASKKIIINKLNSEEKYCKYFNEDYKQYYHDFDGVKYPQYLYLSQNYTINFDCLNNNRPMKTILAWNRFYGEANFGYGLGKTKPFRDHFCPVTNCELTNDKRRLNESDLVMVMLTDSIDTPIPTYRGGRARWVSVVIESPVHTPSYSIFNGVFNYTSDYLDESEFGLNYESQKQFLWGLNTTFDDNHDYSAGKSGFMVALISNCNAWHNRRLDYINELRKYIEVDIYGKCGIECPRSVDCRQMAGSKYKFYFAFENCNCEGYITEKFFQLLKFDIVLVVFGGGNYTRFVSNYYSTLY